MSRLERLLSQYAAYHLDRRNVFSHFIGVPLIVFSIICLLARAQFAVAGYSLDLALVVMVLAVIYYLSLDLIFAVILAAVFAFMYAPAQLIAGLPLASWLLVSIGIFVVGWIIQFIGHYYEKKKPAFMDDLIGLAMGPMFVVAELVFLLGLRKDMEQRVLEQAKKMREEMNHKHLHTVST